MGGEALRRAMDASTYPRYASDPKGKHIENLYRNRLGQFTDRGQYFEQGLISKLHESTVADHPNIVLQVYSPPDLSRPTFEEATSCEFTSTSKGKSFGPSWSTHWFKVYITVPEHMRDAQRLELHWDADCEGLIWTHDGKPVQGLTGYGERTEWILPDQLCDGKRHLIYIELACNDMFGQNRGGIGPPDMNKYYTLKIADIVAVNLQARALYYDWWYIHDAALEFPDDGWERHAALTLCNDIIETFAADNGSKKAIDQCRKLARKYVGDKVDSADVYKSDEHALVTGIGNCHIDNVWLWPVAETKRKIVRSWMNQCDLLDRYPEHRFVASQAQQFKWLEILYPAAFDRVKEKVKAGTFSPIGGTWIENDTNLPSGESLVRQFLYGQRYFQSRFGQRCSTYWLPDTFGYSTQLPQLARLSGLSRFFTQKLSWNNINNFPHTTFNWVALDKSQVLCHMCPAETYTADAHFGDLKRSVTRHKTLDQDNTSLLAFGKGDGGGGPTFGHLEKLRRGRGISDTIGLLPRVNMGASVDDFFAQLEEKIEGGIKFPTWFGELYFELHRGTYTTQAKMKRHNRTAEKLLHDIELLATLATLKPDSTTRSHYRYVYPKKVLDSMWEKVLYLQQHDSLPGSAIEMVYDDADKTYNEIFTTGAHVLDCALKALGFCKPKTGQEVLALNTLGWGRTEYFSHLSSSATQTSCMLRPRRLGGLLHVDSKCSPTPEVSICEKGDGVFVLCNSRFEVEVSGGVITSLYDKHAKRQVVARGQKANQLVIFDDKPLYWQAWDVEVYHLDSRKELHSSGNSRITEDGPHRVSIETTTKISSKSSITTTITLAVQPSGHATAPIEVTADVDWHEEHKFLKVEFPVDVTSLTATYETQFGLIERPTHYNTSWDMAKFEVCCHKFADLSENTYGVSILNDAKYGFAVAGDVMRLSLLRSPKAPDAHADMGRHVIRWGIMPHSGRLGPDTVRRAFEFNNPVRVLSHDAQDDIADLMDAFRLDEDPACPSGLVVDTIKRAEDDRGSDVDTDEMALHDAREKNVVVRVYDSMGGRVRSRIHVPKTINVKAVWKCNLLEDDLQELGMQHDGERQWLEIELGAFEVATFRFQIV